MFLFLTLSNKCSHHFIIVTRVVKCTGNIGQTGAPDMSIDKTVFSLKACTALLSNLKSMTV